MSYFKLIAATAISISVLYSAPSKAAGVCGLGAVVEVREGGFDSDDLFVRLEQSGNAEADSSVANTLFRNTWVRYQASILSAERLNAIRSLAYLAFVSGKPVYVYTHTDECSNATEMALYDESVDPRGNGTL